MPRNYASIRKKSTPNPSDMEKALEEVKNGKSLRKCAEKYSLSVTTLHRHLKLGSQLRKRGGQTVLSAEEEALIVDRIKTCSDWGYPIDSLTLRLLVKDYLERQGKIVRQFKNNCPGTDFVVSFLKRHKEVVSSRMCQNIKRSRAAVSPDVINCYFDELEKELKDVPPSNIVNYDETNLCDDPGRKKLIFRRGCKYPERVMNSSKASTSVMFAASADGTILPPYVVYKAVHLYDSWREGGPRNSRYNRTKSGWFDTFCFADWVQSIAIPYFRNLGGSKFLIGDNLASHLSTDIIKTCNDNQIRFIFLPGNSTHITQPLDVAFFRPMKMAWRKILEEWKQGPGRRDSSVPKDKFPALFRKLCDSLQEKNVLSGFEKCGIYPLCRKKVLDMLPSTDAPNNTDAGSSSTNSGGTTPVSRVESIDDAFKELLKSFRQFDTPQPKKRRTKVKVTPGKSVEVKDFEGQVTADQSELGEEQGQVTADLDQTEPGPRKGKPKSWSDLLKGQKKKRKKLFTRSSSEDSNSNYSIQDSDKEFILSTTSEEDPDFGIPESPQLPNTFAPGDFLVVKVHGKKSYRLYVAKVLYPEDDGYVGKFYKRVPNTWRFQETEEEAAFLPEDVIKKLQPNDNIQTSARFKDMITFVNDMSELNLY